jgi:hypothetical protein
MPKIRGPCFSRRMSTRIKGLPGARKRKTTHQSFHIMDPVSIVVSSVGLVSTCSTLSGHITWLMKQVESTDAALIELRVQIDSLSQIFGAISACFGDPIVARSAETGSEADHWRNVHNSMADCKAVLEIMYRDLKNVGIKQAHRQKSFRNMELNLDPASIDLLKHQVIAYRKTMETSLQLLKQ